MLLTVELSLSVPTPPRWRNVRAFASHAGDRGSIPGRDRPNSLKQVVTAPLPNTWQQTVCVSRVLLDDLYKGFTLVTVGVAR